MYMQTLTIETEGTTVHIPISQVRLKTQIPRKSSQIKAVYGYDDIKPEDSPELLLVRQIGDTCNYIVSSMISSRTWMRTKGIGWPS